MTPPRVPVGAFRSGMEAGRSVVMRILEHPRARDILDEFARAIQSLAVPELAPDQIAITDFSLAVGSWPERTGWLRPDDVLPVDPAEPAPAWPLYVDNADSSTCRR